jgi:hypothetical protein
VTTGARGPELLRRHDLGRLGCLLLELGDELDLEAELVRDGGDRILVESLVDRGHEAHAHAGGDHLLRAHLHHVRELGDGDELGRLEQLRRFDRRAGVILVAMVLASPLRGVEARECLAHALGGELLVDLLLLLAVATATTGAARGRAERRPRAAARGAESTVRGPPARRAAETARPAA